MPFADLPPAPPPAAEQAQVFDLARLPAGDGNVDLRAVKPRCPAGRAGEIVVCAPDPEKQRVRPLPNTYVVEEGLPRAAMDLGGGVSVDIHAEAVGMPGGAVSNRLMIGGKVKF
ncbi:hypothetical protein V474_19085 [Novosphingobium barchaimii LL02]|uniref:Uncharacterized protein n=1 Tax=Novosphingobium barchaimii LL02 TaxID=1114963 RepID=A0A0J7XVM8_9SPHN|nr:hypothetical protein [Novosphingobium barchaimii]KMS55148.1 hypothetical protein V474_19085 [Novosphingobium barchaimii LL02]